MVPGAPGQDRIGQDGTQAGTEDATEDGTEDRTEDRTEDFLTPSGWFDETSDDS